MIEIERGQKEIMMRKANDMEKVKWKDLKTNGKLVKETDLT